MNQDVRFFKLGLPAVNVLLVLLCLSIYCYDLFFGDGDGVIARLNLNPLKVFVIGQVLLLLLYGMRSRINWLTNLCLVILSVWLALFLAEWILSERPGNSLIVTDGICFPYASYDTVFFKNYRPDCSFEYHAKREDGGHVVKININSQAMRGDEIHPKRPGQKRILLLGDSFIQAMQVVEEHTVGKVMETMLADSIDVIQHGFPSWSPLLEWNWLLKQGLSYGPDVVILFLYPNDFYSGGNVGDESYTSFARFDERGWPVGFQFDEENPYKRRNPWHLLKNDITSLALFKWWSLNRRRKAALSSLSADQVGSLLQMAPEAFSKRYSAGEISGNLQNSSMWDLIALMRKREIWDSRVDTRVQLSLKYMERMNEMLVARGIHFYIALIPNAWQFEEECLVGKVQAGWAGIVLPEGGLRTALEEFCWQHSITFIDLFQSIMEYKQNNPDSLLYFPLNGHWNELGHRTVAEEIVETLKRFE